MYVERKRSVGWTTLWKEHANVTRRCHGHGQARRHYVSRVACASDAQKRKEKGEMPESANFQNLN